ncbi:MAG TPA: DUF151 domain-containing protein [bacterium]|nr:DUF151 domain-containing protein [bacterium]HNS48019.1 DUF151 domain-containing protein [bacterium]
MVEVRIKGIVAEKASGRNILVLEDGAKRLLSVTIGVTEAQAIILSLKKLGVPQPLVYDLLVKLAGELGARPLRIEVLDRSGDLLITQLVYQAGDRVRFLACRPGDGVALALRCQVPIFVHENLMKMVTLTADTRRKRPKPPPAPMTEAEVDRIKTEIENLSAEEFWRRVSSRTEGESGGS